MGDYADPADVALATPPETLVQLFDDDNDGTADPSVLDFYITMAESLVNTKIEQIGTIPATSAGILKVATVFFVLAMGYDRHPEYPRAVGEKMYARADKLILDIREGRSGLDVEDGAIPANEVISVRSGDPDNLDEPVFVFNGFGAMGDF